MQLDGGRRQTTTLQVHPVTLASRAVVHAFKALTCRLQLTVMVRDLTHSVTRELTTVYARTSDEARSTTTSKAVQLSPAKLYKYIRMN